MKLFAHSRSGLFTGQVFGQLKGSQCFTKFPRSSVRFGQLAQQPWQQSHRTLADSTTTQTPETTAAAKSKATQSTNLPLQDQVRLLMRRVPYPVAIITATDPHGPTEKAYRGMTVSSFSTVTLNPEPVLSFNVKRPSETLSALLSSGRFLVHLLAPAKETAALARDFAKGNHNLSILSGHGDFGFVAHGPTEVDGDRNNNDSRPLPLLRRRNTDGVMVGQEHVDFPFVFECRLHPHQMEVHDHTIVLGHIVDTILQRPLDGDAQGQKAGSAKELCLTYADTRFWEMGHEIKNQ